MLDNSQINTEKELFSRIAQGDEEAFNTLFHRYVPRLHTLIMKITRSEGVAKDIIQEVFLYLWIDRESLAEVDVPQNWIFKMAYNRSYTWLSKQVSRNQKYNEFKLQNPVEGEDSLENTVSLHETARLIQEATSLLPEQARRIFQLSRETGLKAAEVADQLNISVQTVRNSLVRSVKFIKDYLTQHGILLPALLILIIL
ncbi:RNA polymerase sigma factor [Niastella yeongjuensis]|uniref:RNA polymerase sigma factor n=1 Tax=Niastella yeongjuensis TaxID=354355 RepID=UPI0009C0249C|nr:sigma-70 family RNA polymerase sigma factor [Niastella yeongjuensis]